MVILTMILKGTTGRGPQPMYMISNNGAPNNENNKVCYVIPHLSSRLSIDPLGIAIVVI